MKIVVSDPNSKQYSEFSKLVQEGADSLCIAHIKIQLEKLKDINDTQQVCGVILLISDNKEYKESLATIRNHLEPAHTPYLYIVSAKVNFDLDEIGLFYPDQMLVAPMSPDTIQNTIQLFLLKISLGYFENNWLDRARKRIWLLVKRGYYQSIVTNEIKYIEAADHYIKIHSEKQKVLLIKISLTDFYKKHLMKQGYFYPLNRSYVINTKKVVKIENNKLYIDQSKPLSIPKKKRPKVLELVGI